MTLQLLYQSVRNVRKSEQLVLFGFIFKNPTCNTQQNVILFFGIQSYYFIYT